MSPSMSRKRHQQEPPIPPVSPSLPPCHLSQHPSTESPPDPLNLRPSDPSISDKKGRRSGRRFASLQRLCDCCVSPKRRRGPRRPRPNLRFTSVATGAASTDTADEGGQIPHFSPSCSSSSSNSSARTRRRRSSGATAKATSPSEAASSLTDAAESRRTTSVCCSSGCETETFLPTSASGRDEPAGVYAYPCLAKTRSKHASPVAAGIGDLGQPGTATSAAARENILLHGSSRGAEELNVLQSQLLHRQLQQRQQQQRAGNLGLLCNLSAGQRTAGIFYKAAAGVSAVAAAAGAAAVACECIRHKAAQTAAMLHPWSSRTLLSERVAAVSAAAEAAVTSASSAAEATGCDDRPVPACCENATTAAAAAAAAEASRAAYLREELLNLAESRYTAVFVPVDKQLLEQMNDEFIRSDISRYPVKNTPAGIVFYSPRYTDDRFIYRHVLLSAGVKKAAEEIANAAKSVFLTEGQFIYQLGIHLSPGWEHFMIFKGEMRELILRRPQQQQDSPNSQDHVQSDEVSEESDDSEPEEPTMPAAATESQSSPRHQDIGRLLQQIAETATIHQVTQQKSLLQQQIAIARAVEKANRLLLLMVQLQRPAQQLPPKMFDSMKCLLQSYFFSSLSHFPAEEEQHQSSAARKYLLQSSHIGRQGQLLLLLLQCVAASRQHLHASDVMELLFLQHKLLLQHRGLMQQRVPRISMRGMERHQQILAHSCAIEAPQELHEQQWEQQEYVQDRQRREGHHLNRQNGDPVSCRVDNICRKNSSCRNTSALRLRKRRGPSLTSSHPGVTAQTDSLPTQQHGKRRPSSCNAAAAATDDATGSDDAAAVLGNVALPRRFSGNSTTLPAAAAGGISSPTSQHKEKRRRYPLKH